MAMSSNAQQALITGIFSGAGSLGEMLAQNAQRKQQQQQFDQQFQRSTAGDLLAANPLGADQAYQAKRRAQQAMLQSLINGGIMPGNAGAAEHMPIDNMDYSGLVGPLGDQATMDALNTRHSDLDLLRNSIQFSGNPQALANSTPGGFNFGSAIDTGMGALNMYKSFGGKLPSFFGNAPVANAASTVGAHGAAAGDFTGNVAATAMAGKNTTGFMGALTGGTGSMFGPASKGLGAAIKGGGIGGILGGFGTAMAIRNGQIGNATLSGAMTGLKYGGPIGAAIGAGVGAVGAAISKNQNATKKDREKFVKQQGFADIGAFNNYLSTLGPEGQALRQYGESVVGRHNKQQNSEWLQRAQALISRPQQARLY